MLIVKKAIATIIIDVLDLEAMTTKREMTAKRTNNIFILSDIFSFVKRKKYETMKPVADMCPIPLLLSPVTIR